MAYDDQPFAFIHGCFSCLFGILTFFGLLIGIAMFVSAASSEYKETECSVIGKHGPYAYNVQRSSVWACDYTLTTPLTDSWEVVYKKGQAEKNGCTQFGTACNYDVSRDCKGKCWVVYDGNNPKDVSMTSKDTNMVVGALIMVIGVISLPCFVGCVICCCYSMQNDGATPLLSTTSESTDIEVELPKIVGVSSQVDPVPQQPAVSQALAKAAAADRVAQAAQSSSLLQPSEKAKLLDERSSLGAEDMLAAAPSRKEEIPADVVSPVVEDMLAPAAPSRKEELPAEVVSPGAEDMLAPAAPSRNEELPAEVVSPGAEDLLASAAPPGAEDMFPSAAPSGKEELLGEVTSVGVEDGSVTVAPKRKKKKCVKKKRGSLFEGQETDDGETEDSYMQPANSTTDHCASNDAVSTVV